MRRFILCGLCLALLTGCSSQPNTEKPEGPPIMKLEPSPVYESIISIPLEDAEPYQPWLSMGTDTVSPDTMGDILCDALLPDGTHVLCYWEPGSDYTKYWAIRQADGTLRRFCQEYAAYTEGYSVEPFTDVLGQDGFRITAPRGAAYTAYDYYTLDDSGTPRLLADCANDVIEADADGDGERELLWFYHDGRDIFYLFRQNGAVSCLCLTDLLSELEEPWLVVSAAMDRLSENCLPVHALQGGNEALAAPAEAKVSPGFRPGRLRFTEEAVHLELKAPAPPSEGIPSAQSRAAYAAFLSGDTSLFAPADLETWGLTGWKDTLLAQGELESLYLDLDGDGTEELLIQWVDDPRSYNGVFHYDGKALSCWQSDAAEGSCRDYPLQDGTMVRQYDTNGTRSYTLFRYRTDGSTEPLSLLLAREERIDPDSTDPCPYYEVDGVEVTRDAFEQQLQQQIISRLPDRSAWTGI